VAALVSGNCAIFKPARETVLIAWILSQLLWEAGVPPEVLHFLPCADDPTGSFLVQDPRVNFVVLTGATETAQLMQRLRPGLDLMAETGGKNAIIVTAMADRDLACRDIVRSAFGHAGQKCSACSLGVLEAEVYDDPRFLRQLRDAAASLAVGSAWDPVTVVPPLIRSPEEKLLHGLLKLDAGEEWLLEPKQDPHNPQLWSPGIRMGVKAGSCSHLQEYFGPVLSLVRATDLEDAITIVNSTSYGLTSGLHSLDDREHKQWTRDIEAGNLYINRGITGAVVNRQPFGGTKASSFGPGAKAGGPNYLTQMMVAEETGLPSQRSEVTGELRQLTEWFGSSGIAPEEFAVWKASIGSYRYEWKTHFSVDHDPSRLLGQDNIFRYVPRKGLLLRLSEQDKLLDIVRVIGAALVCGAPLEVSGAWDTLERLGSLTDIFSGNTWLVESEEVLLRRIASGEVNRVRVVTAPADSILSAAAERGIGIVQSPVVAHGRLELLHYVREVSLSIDYHRYGNLGSRESEERSPLKAQ
jgi:RHH-type proline utilization regulon transcriptional repressor/proline dehydrogenase/delta 1-pyrroline-5-carboxylate dehydrogenase